MRGKRLATFSAALSMRIIPAHAGQTFGNRCSVLLIADHPRACGANVPCLVCAVVVAGSSPRMRGKRVSRFCARRSGRIIPAHAGQTVATNTVLSIPSDHPRACGANPASCDTNISAAGSSPRMRGKLQGVRDRIRALRIIPAHAGQTVADCDDRAEIADHPRACGANRGLRAGRGPGRGSSPRMRGKLDHEHRATVGIRIIPAHAGQTIRSLLVRYAPPDHPRACGANVRVLHARGHKCGSSPRMRGKPP